MERLLLIFQIISSITLVILIIMQAKGTGFGRTFGGGGNVSFTRRGLEKVVFKFTFIVATIFITVSILQVAV
jgi:preprotein translocase subunit SecG